MRPFRWFTLKHTVLLILSLIAIAVGIFFIWAATLQIPSIDTLQTLHLGPSTKIYDRTGTVLLYDLNQNVHRTIVTNDQISPLIQQATISIEDAGFYQHGGVRLTSILRAFFVDALNLSFDQGGSTITQQVVKNSLLSTDKKISRKIKEWILAIDLERVMSKDQILNIYLNESPYGGDIYGVEEASEAFFGKKASDVDLAQAAYLASLPQAPSYYSPYGNNMAALSARKNLVLDKMLQYGYITKEQHDQAENEVVTFAPQDEQSIKAPHFVMYIKQYLEQKYGADALMQDGYTVITTLDYNLQQKAEQVVAKYAPINQKNFNASNEAMVAVDPKTGQILAMVGSRDYFDTAIDGNFNVATAYRQPGSAFKPFVYAEAFKKGYLPSTVVFDVPTEFSTACNPDGTPKTPGADCYMPQNYDNTFVGPINLRDAIAQSRNIPSIKVLYLAGIADSLQLAKDMGITSLGSADQYGLTLVLGGGEVSPLDMTSAYGVFANNGIRNPVVGILKITDQNNNVVEQYTPDPTKVLDSNIAYMIDDVLSDNVARVPEYGSTSPLYIPNYDVAVKTGTTNDSKDAWIIGYNPNISVGAWAGNNNDTPMVKQIAGFIVAPMWNEFMQAALQTVPNDTFEKPVYPDTSSYPPVITGNWDHSDPHEILYYIDKNNPTVPRTTNPNTDPQFQSWEYSVRLWAISNGLISSSTPITPWTEATTTSNDSTTSVLLNQ